MDKMLAGFLLVLLILLIVFVLIFFKLFTVGKAMLTL